MAVHSSQQSQSRLKLFGREREREQLRELFAEAADGHGGLVLISGEAGIGKTTLVEDLVHKISAGDVHVLVGRCYDLSVTPPYGPWLEIFLDCPADTLRPPLRPGSESLDIPGPDTLFRETLDYFKQLSADTPMLLVFDDIHWVDEASLDLLRYLSRELHDTSILVVATYRIEEVVYGHPLYRLLPILVRESHTIRIELKRLNRKDIQSWLADRYHLPETDRQRLVDYLDTSAEGNPFFASEILRTIEEDDVLHLDNGNWRLKALNQVGIPMLLQQVMDHRLQRIDSEARSLLMTAAVIGQNVALQLWGQIAEVTHERLIEVVEDTVAARIVSASADGVSIAFRHALFREALYESVLPPRRRLLHREIAERLTVEHDPDPDAVAYHFQRAGDSRAIEWLMRAGERATGAWAWTEAARRYEAAIGLLPDAPDYREQRAWYLLSLAEVRRYNRARDALAYIDEVIIIARELEHPALSAIARWTRGRTRVAELEYGLPELESSVADIQRLSANEQQLIKANTGLDVNGCAAILAVWLAICSRYDDALTVAQSYLDLPVELRTPLINSEAYLAIGIARGGLGQPEASQWAFNRALDIYVQQRDNLSISHTAFFYLTEMLLPFDTTNLSERDRVLEVGAAAWQAATELNITREQIISPPVQVLEGQWHAVRSTASQVLGIPNYVRHWTAPFGAQVARHQGDTNLAYAYIKASRTTDPAFRAVWSSLSALDQHLLAELALDEGNLEQAWDAIELHAEMVGTSGRVSRQAEHQLLLARYFLLDSDIDPARQRAQQALDIASDPRQPLVLLAAHRFLAALDRRAKTYESAREHLRQALDLANACRAVYERALTQEIAVGVAIDSRELEGAQEMLAEALTFARQVSANPLLERLEVLEDQLGSAASRMEYPNGLTGREVEVLGMVAEGHTDAEIAELLFISPRTVMTHVSNILNKVGLNSRAAAAAYAVRNGLA